MSDAVLVALIVSLPGTIAAIVAAGVAWRGLSKASETKEHVSQLEIRVDGRMDDLLNRTAAASRAEGQSAERQIGADRAVDVAITANADIAAAEARTPGESSA